jgi:2-polyprenyl-3-methyl-5-hydroxy-6-metoxy-1,4-benzoquinol methylase
MHPTSYQEQGESTVYLPLWNEIVDNIDKIMKTIIIDLGCGPGQFAEFLRRRRPQFRYTGLDISRVAIEQARMRCAQFDFIHSDVFTSDILEKGDYEIVVCTEMLEHVEKDINIVERIRPGAAVFASVPNYFAFGHVRYFSDATEVSGRYARFFDNFSVKPIVTGPRATLFFIMGVRNTFGRTDCY